MAEDSKNKAELTEILASEILDKIQKGESVEYDHVRIVGDLDLSRLNLPTESVARTEYQVEYLHLSAECKIIHPSMAITNSKFDSTVNFSNCLFINPANFEDSIFNGNAEFKGAAFGAYAGFRRAAFRSDTDFSGTIFDANADFSDTAFSGLASFSGVAFGGHSYFAGATFGGIADFYEAAFREFVYFSDATFSGNVDFCEAILSGDADFSKATFSGNVDFCGAAFGMFTGFSKTTFSGDANFSRATFSGLVYFFEATFGKSTYFCDVKFSGSIYFCKAAFGRNATFSDAEFNGDADFRDAKFSADADFRDAEFGGQAYFSDVAFSGSTYFSGAKFEEDVLTFRDSTFILAISQEEACRRAKNVLAKAGNRDQEEYHFYREMEAKRIRRGIRKDLFKKPETKRALIDSIKTRKWSNFKDFILYDILEFVFVQKVFGYGVHPFWLFGWWLCFVAAFALIYWIWGAVGVPEISGEISQSSNLSDYLWFSIATAATPGYALYKPLGDFKIVAGIEAILGTFMWAAFITTFARKFSR